MGITIAVGAEAKRLVDDLKFRASYQRLYDSCPWATAFQHIEFVGSWYGIYRKQYVPILVLALSGQELSGVLPLAKSPNGGLVAAGDHQAEYQCWLSSAEECIDFAGEAFEALRKAFPGTRVDLQYLPPGISPTALERQPYFARMGVLRPRERPLAATDVLKFRTKQRNKLNGLNRLGKLIFEELKDSEDFDRRIDAIEVQYNVRQCFADASCGFLSDPLKRPFHERLFSTGLLHSTILRLDDTLIAAHLGMISRDQVHLGVFSSNVFREYAKRSPGLMHIMLLSQHLREQGIPLLDLTPCGQYKEEVATHHDMVHALTLFTGPRPWLKSKTAMIARDCGKAALQKCGVSTEGARNWVATKLNRPFPSGRSKGKRALLGLAVTSSTPSVAPPWHPDPLAELVRYDLGGRGTGRSAFLADAVRRIESGQRACVRLGPDGRLFAWAWVQRQGDEEKDSERDDLPAGSALITGLGFAREADEAFRRQFIWEVGEAAATEKFVRFVWFSVADPALQRLLESLGFQAPDNPAISTVSTGC